MQIYSKSCSTPPGSLWVLDYHFYKYATLSGSSCTTIFNLLCEPFRVELHNHFYVNTSGSNYTTLCVPFRVELYNHFYLLCEPFKVELYNHFELIMRTLQGRTTQPFLTYYANPSGSSSTTIFQS